MSFESAPAHKRAFYASLPQIGMSVGLLLASGVIGLASMLLTDEAFLNWGWRMAFILSAILLIVGSYMRKTVQETKDFSEAKAKLPEAKYPLLDAFKRYPKMMLACMGARFIDGVSFNVFGVYSLTFLTQNHGIDRTHALWAVMISSVVMSVFIPVWGHVADRIGKAKVYGICALILGFASFPAFWVIENHADSFLPRLPRHRPSLRDPALGGIRDHGQPVLGKLRPLRPLLRHLLRVPVHGHFRLRPDPAVRHRAYRLG